MRIDPYGGKGYFYHRAPLPVTALMVDRMGHDPTTFCLQGRCSPKIELPTHVDRRFIEWHGQKPLCVTQFRLKGRRPESCSAELSTLTLRQDVNFP